MKSLLIPILLITLGVGWLLTVLGVVPQIDWVWTLGVALTGILVFVLCGIDKVSVAVGPFFLIASGLSVLRQTGRLRMDLEIPVLVIAAGVLMLVAHSKSVPAPKWLIETRTSTGHE
ncbi:MAG TPA: hypothetical protein VH107_09475 [Lacipirellulaceae bacterium]|jgi:hypothetical protein|nr:hypothetical protein [Lacipirellulaceae bacterium]